MSDERPDEISTQIAASLLGITARRLRQLADEGFITIHRRGRTTVISAVQGYLRSIKSDASRASVDTSMARGHQAKAALIAAHTDKRRAALTERAEAQQMIEIVSETAVRRLGTIAAPANLSPAVAQALCAELAATCSRIEEAQKAAALALVTGDLTVIEGAAYAT